MAIALDANVPCPHCGHADATIRASVYWLLNNNVFDTDASVPCEQLRPPNSSSLAPLSRSKVLLVSAGLLGALTVGIMPAILLPFVIQQIGVFVMILSFVWALVCPALYLHILEKQFEDTAFTRWRKVVYCQNCQGVFIPEEDQRVPIRQARELVYDIDARTDRSARVRTVR